MKAVVFHAMGDIRIDEVAKPVLAEAQDALVCLSMAGIGGMDLHPVRGTLKSVSPGTVLGREGVGVVEQVGVQVRNFKPGDRVLLSPSIACGNCVYCRAGEYAQCDMAHPVDKCAGAAGDGGAVCPGGFSGTQAECVRVPYAHTNLIKLPDAISDAQALLIADAFATGYFSMDMAHVQPGDTVAVFGCGAVGQLAIASAKLKGVARIFAVDCVSDRLMLAQRQGAEIIDFDREDPVQTVLDLTDGIGVDKAVDAVGIDTAARARDDKQAFAAAVDAMAVHRISAAGAWHRGEVPGRALRWAVAVLAKAGTLSVVGTYPPEAVCFPFGAALQKNLRLRMGHCSHRAYIPALIELVRSGVFDPNSVVPSKTQSLAQAVQAYHAFAAHQPEWVKAMLRIEHPEQAHGERQLDDALQDSFPASDAVVKM